MRGRAVIEHIVDPRVSRLKLSLPFSSGALDCEREGLARVLAHVVGNAQNLVERLSVDGDDRVARLQARLRRRAIRLHFCDHRFLRRHDPDLAKSFTRPPLALRNDRASLDRHFLRPAVYDALDRYRNGFAFAADNAPLNALVAHSAKARNAMSIHGKNLIACFQPSLRRRGVRHDVTDGGSGLRFAHRPANCPNDDREQNGQQKTEQWTGKRYDDFVERRNFRQLRPIHVGLALNDVHRRKLRQRNEAPEWQRAERVLDAVDCLFPKRFAEPDAEFLDVKSSPARSQKMTKFMHDDQQIEKDEDLEQDENDARDVQNHVVSDWW